MPCADVLITGGQLARAYSWKKEVGKRWASLTEREREVLWLLTEGLDNHAIAGKLCVTIRTIECHVTNILSKLGVASRSGAAAWVHKHLPDDSWKTTI